MRVLLLVIIFMSVSNLSGLKSSWATLTPGEIQDAIEQELSLRHPDHNGQWWRDLGPAASDVILSMYQNQNLLFYHRIRLLEALAWFPENKQAVELLKQEATSKTNLTLQETAIRALGRSQGVKVSEFLSQGFNSKFPRIRAASGEALSEIAHPEAEKLLTRFLSDEKQTWVVKRIHSHQRRRGLSTSESLSRVRSDSSMSLENSGKKIKKIQYK